MKRYLTSGTVPSKLYSAAHHKLMRGTAVPKSAKLRGTVVLTLALLGSASAQNLDAYRQLKTALNQSMQDRSFSKARSLTDLQNAQKALDTLKPSITSSVLSQGLNDSLSASRASLARSPADLEAQVTQARGLMRSVLYEQTLAATSKAATAPQKASLTNQSRLLAEEFGLSSAASTSLLKSAAAGNSAAVQRSLEQAAARKVQGYLGAVNLDNRASAYLNLTRAASWFTAVQGTPAASNLQVDQFAAAFAALTSGDTAASRSSLQNLRLGAANFVRDASSAVATAPAPDTVPTAPVAAPSTDTPPIAVTPAAPAAAPATSGAASAGGVEQVYAELGRALSAASVADQPEARQALSNAQQALTQAKTLNSALSAQTLAQDLNTLKTRTALRPSDVQSLIGELRNAEAQADKQTGSVLSASSASVSRGVGGIVRVLTFFALALMSLYPLYLLNLAFGSRNPYWRSILAGLLLLLLPAFLEGIAGLIGLLGDVAGVGAIRSATNLTLTQNAWGGPIWALSLALALAALTYGFRGLCIQFGLLGTSKSLQNETQTSLEWDEEI